MRLILTGIFLLSASLTASADEFGNLVYSSDGTRITITGYSGNPTTLTIPDTIAELPVTAIADWAFESSSSLTNVVILHNVTTIGDHAFQQCQVLRKVTIGNGVKSIGNRAFNSCPNMTSATLGSNVTTIAEWAFNSCSRLARLTLPDSVTSIGAEAFYYCDSLTSVAIPAGVTDIGNGAFGFCNSLTGITVHAENPAFSSRDGVMFNKHGSVLVQYPGGRTGHYTVPNGVLFVGEKAFLCASLSAATIPASVIAIGNAAFYNCYDLERAYFTGKPPSLGSSAFDYDLVTFYYLPASAAVWPSTFAGRPAVLWNPEFASLSARDGAVSCTVTGTPGIPVAFEAAADLHSGPWLRLQTTNLTAGSLTLRDPDVEDRPARCYRITGP